MVKELEMLGRIAAFYAAFCGDLKNGYPFNEDVNARYDFGDKHGENLAYCLHDIDLQIFINNSVIVCNVYWASCTLSSIAARVDKTDKRLNEVIEVLKSVSDMVNGRISEISQNLINPLNDGQS